MEPSVARNVRSRCRNRQDQMHCFHPIAQPFEIKGHDYSQYLEVCCHCAPSWMRVNIYVQAITSSIEKVMNEHPIYGFTVPSQIARPNGAATKIVRIRE